MPKRKASYEPAATAKRLEDYEPGAEKGDVFAALRKVVTAKPTPHGSSAPPAPASS